MGLLTTAAFLQYDELYTLDVPTSYFASYTQKKSSNPFKKFAISATQFVQKAFVPDNIASIDINFVKDNGDSVVFLVAITLGSKWYEPVMRGPQANTDNGKKFRETFGELSEIRKFADNSLCESVEWIKLDDSGQPDSNNKDSMGQRYLSFVFNGKLNLPPKALSRLINMPWGSVSVIPRSHLTPSFLSKAYSRLGHLLREADLSVKVVGVNCVSAYYRDTEPYRLQPVLPLNSKKYSYQTLSFDGKSPTYVPTVEVFVSLEKSQSWGKDPSLIASYKTAFYCEMAEKLKSADTCTVPTKDRLLLMMNYVVFSVVIVHDEELRVHHWKSKASVEKTTESEIGNNAHYAIISQSLQSIAHRFTAFSEACQLAKLWLAESRLSGHISPVAVELLVAIGLSNAVGRNNSCSTPMSPSAAFAQFLWLLSNHQFSVKPLFFDINESFTAEDKKKIMEQFVEHRPVLPCICICTPEDHLGRHYTTAGPEPLVMCRLVKLAQNALSIINHAFSSGQQINFSNLCSTDSDLYDATIQLKSDVIPRRVNNSQNTLPAMGSKIPVVDFDAPRQFVEDLKKNVGKHAVFFFDEYKMKHIFVLYRRLQTNNGYRSLITEDKFKDAVTKIGGEMVSYVGPLIEV